MSVLCQCECLNGTEPINFNEKKGDIRVGMRTQNQPRSNGICGIEVEILKEADLAGISNVSCSTVVAGGNKVRPSVH